ERCPGFLAALNSPGIVEPGDPVVAQRVLHPGLCRQVREVRPRLLIDLSPSELDVGHRARQRTNADHRDESATTVRQAWHMSLSVHRSVLRRLQPEDAAEVSGN